MSSAFSRGKWICPAAFAALSPLDLFHKQLDKRKKELPEELKHRHFLIRKKLTLPKKQGRYKLRITADDYYKLSINGSFVCQGPAQGYHFCYYWNEIDVTDFLREGDNELLADLYYQGLINRAYNSGDRRMGLIAELWDEREPVFWTDSSWECAAVRAYSITHILAHNTMVAENYDSRVKPDPWERCAEKETDHVFSP